MRSGKRLKAGGRIKKGKATKALMFEVRSLMSENRRGKGRKKAASAAMFDFKYLVFDLKARKAGGMRIAEWEGGGVHMPAIARSVVGRSVARKRRLPHAAGGRSQGRI